MLPSVYFVDSLHTQRMKELCDFGEIFKSWVKLSSTNFRMFVPISSSTEFGKVSGAVDARKEIFNGTLFGIPLYTSVSNYAIL